MQLFTIDQKLGEIKTSEDIVGQEYEYYEEYARKKLKAYQSLMKVPESTKTELQAIEDRFREYLFFPFFAAKSQKKTVSHSFEKCWKETSQKLAEIQSLTEWYKEFQQSYHQLFVELQRRVQAESDMEHLAEKYRKSLQTKFEHEVRLRNAFNAKAVKYLPPAFHALLMMSPVKYEIFPTQNISPLAGVKVDDQELFGSELFGELVKSGSSAPVVGTEKLVKPRTTTM